MVEYLDGRRRPRTLSATLIGKPGSRQRPFASVEIAELARPLPDKLPRLICAVPHKFTAGFESSVIESTGNSDRAGAGCAGQEVTLYVGGRKE